jgi:GNAT superfamily N-acetyltransferase
MTIQWNLESVGADEIDVVDRVLKQWEGTFGTGTGFASGDLGWALRNGPEATSTLLRVARSSSGELGAVGFVEGENALWLTIDPGQLMDASLAESIADQAVAQGYDEVATAAPPASIRAALGKRGYAVDPSLWVHLWKPLSDADIQDQPNVFATSTDDLIEQRIIVQRSAFENSTFTRDKWNTMAAGPSFVPALDLVAVNDQGAGVAALTAWLPGPDACGMVEPMGTHADHRRQGNGLRVLRACFSELRKLGASGVRVFTPRGNDPAVATYQAAGFLIINLDSTMVRQRP